MPAADRAMTVMPLRMNAKARRELLAQRFAVPTGQTDGRAVAAPISAAANVEREDRVAPGGERRSSK